jgi:hypothetical protein
MWNIKEGLDKTETIAKLKATLEALPAKIDFLIKAELGVNYTCNETGRDVVLYSEVATKEDLEAYLVHPDHKEAGLYVKSVVCDRIDVDYEI